MELWGQNLSANRTITSINHSTPVNATAPLRELFELLEDYAPTWYTEEHHARAAAALGELLPQAALN
jgi:hypothetical protein